MIYQVITHCLVMHQLKTEVIYMRFIFYIHQIHTYTEPCHHTVTVQDEYMYHYTTNI